jgi:bacterial/archaeal transporter family-2 protein
VTLRRLDVDAAVAEGAATRKSREVEAAAAHPSWLLTLPMMLGGGALIALQAQLNGALAHRLGTGLRASALAAVISSGSGLVALTLFALVNRPMGRGIVELWEAVTRRRIPLWLVLGGLAGAFFLASQGVAATRLGIAFFVLCFVAGQSVMGLVVDHRGWGPNGRTVLTGARVLGAALAVLAVAISGAGLTSTVPVTVVFLLLAALPLLAGLLNSVQQGVNGRLSVRSSPWVTTWNNFFVGTLGLVVFFAVTLVLPGRLVGLPTSLWLYVGGLCGIGFIWVSTVTVRIHGVLVVGVFAIAGQVLTAALISLMTASTTPALTTWLAAATSLVGAAVVGLSQRRRPR